MERKRRNVGKTIGPILAGRNELVGDRAEDEDNEFSSGQISC